jgi:hypothetical protein
MNGTTLFGEKPKDLLGELGCRGSETEERMDVGSLLQSWSRGGTQAEVEGETKGAPNGGDAANDISPIDGATVPSVSSGMGGFDKNSVSATVVSGNSDSFIQEPMKVLDTDGFVIATGSNMDAYIQNRTDRLEQALEGTAVVDDDETTETDFQEDFLDEETGEIMGGGVTGGINEDESSEVAHRVHEISFATIVGNLARGPKIDMEDIKGATERPRKDELAVASDGAVRGDAVGALQHPSGDIFATEWPEEPKADAMEGFVDAHVTSGRGSVIGREEIATKR